MRFRPNTYVRGRYVLGTACDQTGHRDRWRVLPPRGACRVGAGEPPETVPACFARERQWRGHRPAGPQTGLRRPADRWNVPGPAERRHRRR
jgi:hypothetical protein